jgi:hypothetical protein
LVVPIGELGTLATVAPIEEVLANADPVAPPRKQPNGNRRSHNRTASGEPLVDYSDPQHAGVPHNGRIGKKERDYVVANLAEVNARRRAAGHPPLDLSDPAEAERYGLAPQAQEPAAEEQPTPEQAGASEQPAAAEQETPPQAEQPSESEQEVPEQESAAEQQPARRSRRGRQQQ